MLLLRLSWEHEGMLLEKEMGSKGLCHAQSKMMSTYAQLFYHLHEQIL